MEKNVGSLDELFEIKFKNLCEFVDSGTTGYRLKVNHGFWDRLTYLRKEGFWPLDDSFFKDKALGKKLDLIARSEGLISSGVAKKVCEILGPSYELPSNFETYISLVAAPKGVTKEANTDSLFTLRQITNQELDPVGATLPKYLVEKNQLHFFLTHMTNRHVILVANANISSKIKIGDSTTLVNLPTSASYLIKDTLLEQIKSAIINIGSVPIILIQAGTMSVYLSEQVGKSGLNAQWIDLGLALSAFCPDSLVDPLLPWFTDNYKEIVLTHNTLIENNFTKRTHLIEGSLDFQHNLIKEIISELKNDSSEKSNLLNLYDYANSFLGHLPTFRLKLLSKLLISWPKSVQISDLLEKEATNDESQHSFNSLCQLVELLSKYDELDHFDTKLNDARLLAPNDPKTHFIEARHFLRRREYDKVRDVINSPVLQTHVEYLDLTRIRNILLKETGSYF